MDTSPKFSQELFAKLCEIVSTGETVTGACRQVGITFATLWRWLKPTCVHYESIKDAWAEALELQAHAGFDDLDRAAQPVPGEDAVGVAARRLLCDQKKWRLSKMHKRYSDKSEIEHTGQVDSNIKINVQFD